MSNGEMVVFLLCIAGSVVCCELALQRLSARLSRESRMNRTLDVAQRPWFKWSRHNPRN